jgi:CRP/FNR family cyclic AMP-dependent transcriptional regulator
VNIVLQADGGPGANVAILGPGEFFGEMAVLEGRPRMAAVIARDRCTLLEIDGARFREFLIRHPEIEFKIAAKLSQRLRDVTEHVLTARFKDVDQRRLTLN